MKKNLLMVALVAMGCTIVSCSESKDETIVCPEPKTINLLPTTRQPIELTTEEHQFATDNNNFALNFLKTVNDADNSGKSFIYSPLSITYVLGMVNSAATGQTEQEIEQTLGFHQGGIQAINNYCKKLIDGLPKTDDKVTLNIANAIFVNKNLATLKPQYQQDMLQYYSAKAENLNFDSPTTLATINSWANNQTNGMIDKILDRIEGGAISYLLNAIYFKADWASKFDPKMTKTETFYGYNCNTQLPLMHQNVLIYYMKNDIFSAVSIPYGNGLWNMTVLLPNEGKNTNDVITSLAKSNFQKDVYFKMHSYEVDLKIPRFETTSDTDDLEGNLVGIMKKLGIKEAFDQNVSEIPNMCNEGNLYINKMRQKAAIKVNEEGSEAAAVTVAEMNLTTSLPEEKRKATFHADHPFVYLITEASTGVIMFVGSVR